MTKVGVIGHRVQEIALYALLVFLSFSNAITESLFFILFICWIIARIEPETRYRTVWVTKQLRPILIGIACFIIACIISVITSSYFMLSLRGFVFKWLEYLLFFIIVADVASEPRIVNRSYWFFTISSLLLVIEGLTQEIFGQGLIRGIALGEYDRMTGPFNNPNSLSTCFVLAIPLVLTLVITARSIKIKQCAAFLLVLLMGAVARTEALSAWVGVGAAFIVMIVLHKKLRKWGTIIGLSLLVVIVIDLVIVGQLHQIFSVLEGGKRERWYVWQTAFEMIRAHPFVGMGLNTFMANYEAFWVGGPENPQYAHNCYLQLWAEIGIVGLCAFLLLMWKMISYWVRSAKHMSSDVDRIRLVGLIAGLIGFLVQSAFETNFFTLRTVALFWVLSGLAVAATFISRQKASFDSELSLNDQQKLDLASGPDKGQRSR